MSAAIASSALSRRSRTGMLTGNSVRITSHGRHVTFQADAGRDRRLQRGSNAGRHQIEAHASDRPLLAQGKVRAVYGRANGGGRQFRRRFDQRLPRRFVRRQSQRRFGQTLVSTDQRRAERLRLQTPRSRGAAGSQRLPHLFPTEGQGHPVRDRAGGYDAQWHPYRDLIDPMTGA